MCALRNPVPGQSLKRGMDMGGMGVLCLFMCLLDWIPLSHKPTMVAKVIQTVYDELCKEGTTK